MDRFMIGEGKDSVLHAPSPPTHPHSPSFPPSLPPSLPFFNSRNREQRDLVHDEHHPTLDVAHQNGENAIPMGKDDFPGFIAENEYVFANFYAPWCVWCQRLGPTWEAFAETVEKQQFNIKVGREGGREEGVGLGYF